MQCFGFFDLLAKFSYIPSTQSLQSVLYGPTQDLHFESHALQTLSEFSYVPIGH